MNGENVVVVVVVVVVAWKRVQVGQVLYDRAVYGWALGVGVGV